MPDGRILPIVAAVEEAEAIVANVTDAVLFEIAVEVGTGPPAQVIIDSGFCTTREVPETPTDRVMISVLLAICNTVNGLLDGADTSLGNLIRSASEGINRGLDLIENLATSVTNSIVSALDGIIGSITEQLDRTFRGIAEVLDDTVRSIGRFVANIIEAIELGISDVMAAIGLQVSELIGRIANTFSGLLEVAEAVVERIGDTVRNMGEFFTTMAEATLVNMSNTVASVLGPLVGAGQSVLARLGDLVESVPGAVKDAASALAAGIGEFVGDPLGTMGTIMVGQIEEFFGKLIDEKALSYGEVLRTLLTGLGAPASAIERIAQAADDAAPETPAFFLAALAFVVPLVVAQFIGSALEPLAEQVRQEVSQATRQTLIPTADIVDGFLKGDINLDQLEEELTQAGYSDGRILSLIKTARLAPDIGTAIQAWLRDIIEDDELNEILVANRMRAQDIELLKQVVFFVPPAQDLIRMAVREVFSPEIRERFGQDEDFPTEFATFAKQQGISEEWARSYWAAHWVLPSPNQGFEMLHRKVIEPEDLDSLLRALDVMPFWREKLTQIAFSPLTRVDLRRMHGLGLLTDAELQIRYEALGFDADNAALMVVFTIAFNASPDEVPDELEGLTRSSVLGMFDDGILDRATTVDMLLNMDIGTDAAELFVDQRELEAQRSERRDLIESVVRLAGGGVINLPDAQDSLANIGITAVESARALTRILGLREGRDRLPSLSDLNKMRLAGIIDDDQWKEALGGLGFNDDWVARQFTLVGGAQTT